MDKSKALTENGFNRLLKKCFEKFALRSVVDSNDGHINEYVLNIDYDALLAFDTTELVSEVREEEA